MEVIFNSCIICAVDVDNCSENLKCELIKQENLVERNLPELKLGLQLFWKLLQVNEDPQTSLHPLNYTENGNELIPNCQSEKKLECCDGCLTGLKQLLSLHKSFQEIQVSSNFYVYFFLFNGFLMTVCLLNNF